MVMHHKEFIAKLDEAKILAAIARAEQSTSGEIRVAISRKLCADALGAAQKRFVKLGMHRTPQRNAVLIYFAPKSQAFAVWGDVGVHEKCGAHFWSGVAAKITPWLKAGQFTEAVETAVNEIGEVLARHFPRGADGQNHLPDDIVRD